MKNSGIWLTLFMCCGWPLIFYGVIEYVKGALKRRDWTSIQWSEIRWPWTRSEDK